MKPLSKITEKIPEAMSLQFNMAAYDLRCQGKDIIDLSSGETLFKLPLFSFKRLDYKTGFHYSSSFGTLELRKKISQYYFNQYGVKADANREILISAGSKIVIYLALKAILNPGEEVIIMEPAWVSYPEQVRLAGGKPVLMPHGENLKDLVGYITAKTKAIIVNNPQNPSGKVYCREELTYIYNLVKKRGIYIIADEVYGDFTTSEPFVSLAEIDKKKEVVLTISSLSKTFGISGLRIGYIIAHEKYIKSILKLNQHLITCPATLLEQYVTEHFSEFIRLTRPQIKDILSRREEVAEYSEKIGLKYLAGSATLYIMISLGASKLKADDFAWKLLKEYHVATVPGTGYGRSTARYLRISVGAESLPRIKQAVERIKKLIELTKK